MTIDPFAVVGSEMAREVGNSLLERIEVPDFLTRAAEDAHNVVKDFGVHIGDELRVEILKLGE